jgi:hypothetical protein
MKKKTRDEEKKADYSDVKLNEKSFKAEGEKEKPLASTTPDRGP